MDRIHDNSALIDFAYNHARRSAAREQSRAIRLLFADLHQAVRRKLHRQKADNAGRNQPRYCA